MAKCNQLTAPPFKGLINIQNTKLTSTWAVAEVDAESSRLLYERPAKVREVDVVRVQRAAVAVHASSQVAPTATPRLASRPRADHHERPTPCRPGRHRRPAAGRRRTDAANAQPGRPASYLSSQDSR